jgi:hypothetical protein
MLGLILLAVASATSDADAANAAFTQCLFATARKANDAHLSVGGFEALLGRSCLAEQRELERATTRIFAGRGEADANGKAKRLGLDSRRMVVDSYRKARELEPQFKSVAALCKAHPEKCND